MARAFVRTLSVARERMRPTRLRDVEMTVCFGAEKTLGPLSPVLSTTPVTPVGLRMHSR